jgi:predicted DNA-binding antitoxin AbrB/MazE fold protein
MIHNVDAIYDQGVFRPIDPVNVPVGARVHLRVEEKPAEIEPVASPVVRVPSLFERLKDIVGTVDDLPEDSSTNLDHYLYGTPKR